MHIYLLPLIMLGIKFSMVKTVFLQIYRDYHVIFFIYISILCHVRLSFFRLMVVVTGQIHSAQSTLRICTCSNPAYRMLEVCKGFWIRTDFCYEVRNTECHKANIGQQLSKHVPNIWHPIG